LHDLVEGKKKEAEESILKYQAELEEKIQKLEQKLEKLKAEYDTLKSKKKAIKLQAATPNVTTQPRIIKSQPVSSTNQSRNHPNNNHPAPKRRELPTHIINTRRERAGIRAHEIEMQDLNKKRRIHNLYLDEKGKKKNELDEDSDSF